MKMKMAKMQLKAMELAQKVFYHRSRGVILQALATIL